MLNLFHIENLQAENGVLTADLQMDAAHPVFEGHFPGKPVVPGVCMLQVVKEIVEQELSCPIRILSAENLKFLAVMVPGEVGIQARVKYMAREDKKLVVSGTLVKGDTVYFKMTAVLVKENDAGEFYFQGGL